MTECPACLGAGGHDFTDVDAPLARLARVFGWNYRPMHYVECDVCEGTGEATEEAIRDWDAWAVARVDQLKAGIASGEIAVP